jgi:hypothetical protein
MFPSGPADPHFGHHQDTVVSIGRPGSGRAAPSIVIGVIVAVLAVAAPGTSARAHRGKLKGKVVDTTCYGPCVVHSEPPLYTGEVRVVITRVRNEERVATLGPEAGRFKLHLRPARYELAPSFGEDPCWQGPSVRARVRRSRVSRVRLEVENACVLRGAGAI